MTMGEMIKTAILVIVFIIFPLFIESIMALPPPPPDPTPIGGGIGILIVAGLIYAGKKFYKHKGS